MSLFSDSEAVETMQLERALGLTTTSNAALATLPSGQLVYVAGCVAVLFDPELNVQKGLFKIDHAITAVCVSPDGRYLALGSRAAEANVYVYDIANGDELAELKGHKFGVGCMCFSPDNKMLVTCGFKADKQMLCWNWRAGASVYNKIGNRVHCVLFNVHGNYFVTCGDRHLKWWYYTKSDVGEVLDVRGFPASIMEAQRYSNFTDCTFGAGTSRHILYCSTAGGGLCIFHENRIMDQYIDLNCASSNCLLFSAGMLYIGCSDGICSVYSVADMKLLGALPKPDALPASACPALASPGKQYYAACYAIRMVPNSRNVAVVYADRTMAIWDASDLKHISMFRLLLSHRACIWDIHFLVAGNNDLSPEGSDLTSAVYPANTFVTCSADASIRLWNIDPKLHRYSKVKIPYCKDVYAVIDTSLGDGGALPFGTAADPRVYDLCTDIPDTEQPYRIQVADSPRCMAINPNGNEFACGDRTGKIKFFDITNLGRSAKIAQAHDSEVLSLSYSPLLAQSGPLSPRSRSPPSVLLASGGRDSLIHVFDIRLEESSRDLEPISTLSLHDSAVSIVKFTPDGQKLISCGSSDERMVFSRVFAEGDEKSVVKLKTIPTPNGAANGLAFDATNKYAITSGQNKRLNIWNIKTGRQARSYFLESAGGELYRSDIDPSGMYIVTCALDRKIRIFDFFSGDVIAEVYGHSDAITGVKFSPDGRYILSIGGDGCILVWKVPPTLVAAMQDRLMELYSTAQKRLQTAKEASKSISEASKSSIENRNSSEPPPAPKTNAAQPDFMPPPAPAPQASKGPSRWVSRAKAEEADGYELFGQKISISSEGAAAARVRNKFTLEVSGIDLNFEGNPNPSSPGSKIASEYEDLDNVNVDNEPPGVRALNALLDNKEPTAPSLPKSKSPNKVVPKKGKPDPDEDDLELSRASGQAESLHRSAVELESWLEQQLAEENKTVSAKNALSSSMSAAYYTNLKKSDAEGRLPAQAEMDVSEPDDGFEVADVFGELAGNLSPARNSGQLVSDRASDDKIGRRDLDARSQKTAAAVGQMRDRLLAMGILQVASTDPIDAPPSPVRNINARSLKLAIASNTHAEHAHGVESDDTVLMPPPPPYEAGVREENKRRTAEAVDRMRDNLRGMGYLDKQDDRDDETESTVSATDQQNGLDGLDEDVIAALADKTQHCSSLLLELERVSKKAAEAVNDLKVLRKSVGRSSVSASRSRPMSPGRNSKSNLRASPILIPSDSPTKGSSGRSLANSRSLSGKSGDDIVLREADDVISSFQHCCSSLAASVSISAFDDDADHDFKVQHIIEGSHE